MNFQPMKNPKTYGLTHLAIAVHDVNRTLKFYQDVFDMEVMYHSDGFLQLTTPGCNDILVFEEKKGKPIGESGGILHFGFRLKDPSDVDEVADKIIVAGGTITDKGEFVPGSPYVFFKDPDGYQVEVWYEVVK
jgi:catechol 2,3-dioxygenase-like lactoylglutathione lyase family enzyme